MNDMESCPYLKYKASSCASCTGYMCQAYGREKKLSDTKQCKSDYVECPRYIDTNPKPPEKLGEPTIFTSSNADPVETITLNVTPEISTYTAPPVKQLFIKSPCGCGEDIRLSNCPYQSTSPPAGMNPCTGVWCYANNKSVRVPKNCWNFQICTVYLMSKMKGVPFP